MDIQIFDNFEDDGQLTLFGLEEEYEELRGKQPQSKESVSEELPSKEPVSVELPSEGPVSGQQSSGQDSIRIRRCSSCGKLLFVREEDGGYVSTCNACGIQYIQK